MDHLFDQVRQRTDELRRVAADVRRERDLRAAAVAAAVARSPLAPAIDAGQPAPARREDSDGTCATADLAA